jgi:hypothetical protein
MFADTSHVIKSGVVHPVLSIVFGERKAPHAVAGDPLLIQVKP